MTNIINPFSHSLISLEGFTRQTCFTMMYPVIFKSELRKIALSSQKFRDLLEKLLRPEDPIVEISCKQDLSTETVTILAVRQSSAQRALLFVT